MAYLAMGQLPVARTQLCELLWEVPNDPRGELRWSLSKIRSVVDQAEGSRVRVEGDTVALDLDHCVVDAIEILHQTENGVAEMPVDTLLKLSSLITGDFLEGAEIGHSPLFNGWVIAQRHRFRALHAAILEQLVLRASDEAAFEHLEAWRLLAPFDRRVHELILRALARQGRIREGDEHLAATAKLFEAEGLESGPLRQIWRAARDGTEPAKVVVSAPAQAPSANDPKEREQTKHRASIAVMPFVERSRPGDHGGLSAEGLVHDVITRLAKLRGLLVISQGTVFALHERGIGSEEAGRTLNVDYVASGTFERRDGRIIVSVELVETKSARIVCAEEFERKLDDLFLVMDDIGNRIVALIAGEIEAMERNRAILKPPSSLNAWETYHRGLWHFYRFTREDNERALHFFENAVRLDPTFARAHSGVSFAHFQNGFQGWATRDKAIDAAYEAAGQSLMADERDPAAHCAMGRALWLRDRFDQSIVELERSVELSPNYVMGHYSMAFIQSQAGSPQTAIASSDLSRMLSPFDPLLFAMFGARAMALARLGDFAQAADWATKAAARPNAHKHVLAIAAFTLALADRGEQAAAHLAAIRKDLPGYGIDDFFTAMHFSPQDEALFRAAAKRHRLD